MATLPLTIDSNQTGLSFAEEVALKTLPTTGVPPVISATWNGLEPNSYSDFGAKFTSVARQTINQSRQQQKGTLSGLDATANFQMDLTQHNFTKLGQGYFFANLREKYTTKPINGTQIVITGVTATQYQAASGLGAFLPGHIVKARNFLNAANNGMAIVTAAAAGTLTTAAPRIVETTPPANAAVAVVGFQFPAGDLSISTIGGLAVLTSATIALDTQLGLIAGEGLFIGGDTAATQFVTMPNGGYAMIQSVSGKSAILTTASLAPVADTGAGQTVQVFFGSVLKNEQPGAILRRSYTLERTLGFDGTGTQAEYLVGSIPNEMTLNLAQSAKATLDLTFVGMDVVNRTGALGPYSGTRVAALGEQPFNTSQHVYSSRLYVLNSATSQPTGLYGYASDIKVMVNNQTKADKAIGTLGSIDATSGDFMVTANLTSYFTTVAAVDAIRQNDSVGLNVVLASANAGIILDIPLLTIGDGQNKVAKDAAITVDITATAAECANGYTALMNFFEYLPTLAMAK